MPPEFADLFADGFHSGTLFIEHRGSSRPIVAGSWSYPVALALLRRRVARSKSPVIITQAYANTSPCRV